MSEIFIKSIILCENCNNPIGNFSSLRFCSDFCRHSYVAKIANLKTEKCNICEKFFPKNGIKQHIKSHEKENEKRTKVYICENCGKTKIGIYGGGRFCCKECAKAFCTKAKRKEINEKVSEKLKGRPNKNGKIKTFYNKICLKCGNEFKTKKDKQIYCSQKCANLNKSCSELTKKKISLKVQERVKNGTHKGWQSRKIRSYAELFFETVLKNNKIFKECEIEFKVNKRELGLIDNCNYFLDFYFPNIKLDLEIDGKQHNYKERKESDLIRDKLLKEKLQIDVYRIKWKPINNDKGKEYIKKEIEKFLKYYNNKKL